MKVVSRESRVQWRDATSMLLVIPGVAELRSAIEAANDFLVYRRRNFSRPREADEVLGIWLRRAPDGVPVTGLWSSSEFITSAVEIRESVSLSGRWSLCWLDGVPLRAARTARERRTLVVDALVTTGTSQPTAFLPVFDATETIHGLDATLQELRASRPGFISAPWFIDDRERGLVDPRVTR